MEEFCLAAVDEIASVGFSTGFDAGVATTGTGLGLATFGEEWLEEEDPNEENVGLSVAAEELVVNRLAEALTTDDVVVLAGGGDEEQETNSGNSAQKYPAKGNRNLFITNLLRLH